LLRTAGSSLSQTPKTPLINLTNNSINRDIVGYLRGLFLLSISGVFAKCGTCHNLNDPVFIAFLPTAFHKMFHVKQFKADLKSGWHPQILKRKKIIPQISKTR
jgi:hypothetical protein